MRVFSIVLLILVGVVFVITPAGLLADLTHATDSNALAQGLIENTDWLADALGNPEWYYKMLDNVASFMAWIGVSLDKTVWVGIILVYYMLATVLPIDKLIGNLYPLFGFALLFMAVGIFVVLIYGSITGTVTIPDGLTDGLHTRYKGDAALTHPIFPMMFVSIACGAISGFHATQSPMMARCLKNEKLARPVFYGAMVTEGFVALIWAAGAIAFVGGYDAMSEYMKTNTPGSLVHDLSFDWLGTFGGLLAMIGVIAAPISTGDTALRSARLIVADFMKMSQKKFLSRLAISIPIFAIVFAMMFIDFNVLWRYFAWSNQTLAVFTLWACTVYLARKKKFYYITLLPAIFMTAVSVSYLMFSPRPEGLGINWGISVAAGVCVAISFTALFYNFLRKYNNNKITRKFDY
ncbi:MAG: carbon starvation protein A [Muribaculaceae bacterium]|nr:carbon starvation protein A [Muribaculaceae bacterium]